MPGEEEPGRSREKQDADRRGIREWNRLVGLVYELLAYMLVLGYVGYLIDERRGLNGWGLFGGLMLGLVVWIYRALRVTRNIFK